MQLLCLDMSQACVQMMPINNHLQHCHFPVLKMFQHVAAHVTSHWPVADISALSNVTLDLVESADKWSPRLVVVENERRMSCAHRSFCVRSNA